MVVSEFESIPLLYRVSHAFRYQAQRPWLGLSAIAALVSLLGLLSYSQQVLSNASLFNTSLVAQAAQAHPSLSTSPPSTPSVPASTAAAAVQSCTPDSAYGTPSQLDLTADPDGLTQIIDDHSYYQVYGNTAAQIHGQVKQCAPNGGSEAGGGDEFAAETGYRLTWQYDTTASDAGTCTVSNVKIGLHLNMVLPEWRPTAAAGNGLVTAWQKYVSSLATHENGHVAIDQQYAGQLLSDLQAYPATDCGSMAASIQAKINADTAALDAANDAYDARTNHGATQGAILP
jgi:predicted secreted Zn-dependent protease